MKNFVAKVEEARDFLAARLKGRPEVIIILGTGLGGLAELIEEPQVIAYEDIPNFPRSTVQSHTGNLIAGRLGGREVVALQGRFHYYEGYSCQELTLPLRVLSLLGPRCLLVANAAGGLNPAYAPGTLMVISDHINLIPDNPLRGPNVEAWGPRFPDLSHAYDPELVRLAQSCGRELGLERLACGTYVAIPGPSLETPAETRYLRQCGADAVGMSTVPEVIVAVHAGLKVLGLAMVANVNDPDNQQPILMADILAQAKVAEGEFQRLVVEILTRI
ncbi:MAG: purine-nucleoside phosphorylase [Thermodesulfobacteriota bacterium]